MNVFNHLPSAVVNKITSCDCLLLLDPVPVFGYMLSDIGKHVSGNVVITIDSVVTRFHLTSK